MAKEKTGSIFDNFTHQYSLSKTLRFRLIPKWNTQNLLNLIEEDRIRNEKYKKTKIWFDRLHQEFINEALADFKFKDLKKYYSALNDLQKDRKSREKQNDIAKAENELRNEVVIKFEITANNWADKYKNLGLKKGGMKILFEADVFKLIKEKYKNEQDASMDGKNIFDDWGNWTGYFKKFFETRKNFYKSDDTSTAIAFRIVNQNLRYFCKNIKSFEEINKKVDISEVENNFSISRKDLFSTDYYNKCVLQNGIDAYNKIIGGEIRQNGQKIQGINELINKYRQDNRGENLPLLKELDKQIHSDSEKFIEDISSNAEFLEKLAIFYSEANSKLMSIRRLVDDFSKNYSDYGSLGDIYLSKEALVHNSNYFSDYENFEKDLFAIVADRQNKKDYDSLRIHRNDSKIENKDGVLRFPDFIKCIHIKQALDKQTNKIWKEKYYEKINNLKNVNDKFVQFLIVFRFELERLFLNDDNELKFGYDIFAKKIKTILNADKLAIGEDERIAIKNFADTVLAIYRMGKYFAVEKRRTWLANYDLNDKFYNEPENGYFQFYRDGFEKIINPYNLIRNYLTKKPYNLDKWPLYFENPTLADGWDKNKESDNMAVIFEKDGNFFLGIMNKNYRKIFIDEKESTIVSDKNYKKMIYKYFPNPSRMIPKCSTQLGEVKDHFKGSADDFEIYDKDNFIKPLKISKRIFELNNYEYPKSYLQSINGADIDELRRVKADSSKTNQVKLFQKDFFDLSKNEEVYKKALTDWVNFCKKFLESYKSTAISGFDYSRIKNADDYNSIDEFYRDVEAGSYKLTWGSWSDDYLKEKNQKGELFVFEIYNKDWSLGPKDKKRKRTKNLHTLYWENLFSGINFKKNFPFKLNGGAELFFRLKTAEEKLGYKIKIWDEKEKKYKWKIDKKQDGSVINRKRYTNDKAIFFHCPITINRISENKTETNINTDIRTAMSKNEEKMNVIGIDRGEKNLIYYSLIDRAGNIIKTESLNIIDSVNYAVKLGNRAKEREEARREWRDVENIKDLKNGYMSRVAREIADLAIQNDAIIVLEDLSMRFRQIRGGVEKSVYQQLEKVLIDKFNYLVFKNKSCDETGGSLNGYQLSAPFKSFREMGKQTGAIFYTQAGYTSKTCPKCGYRRNIKIPFNESIERIKNFIIALDFIVYDSSKNAFDIGYSKDKFIDSRDRENKKANRLYQNLTKVEMEKLNKFVLSTKGSLRYKWYDRYSEKSKLRRRGEKEYNGEIKENETKKGIVKEFNITEYLKGILDNASIDINSDIKKQILSVERKKEFYREFLYALFLLTETRQSISNTNVDYIHCPHCGFNSLKGFQGIEDFGGDANGAYNIARKGILIIEKIKQFKKNGGDLAKMGWGDLSVGIDEWDKFTQLKNTH